MSESEHQVVFKGTAGEYFGIWIVNILLSIITLGIYGAWAKVRTKTYFYGSTVIDDHSFDYHATGKQIFIGRLVSLGALLALGLTQYISPILYLILLLALLILVPLLICRALRFNARVSSYRNVRFDFIGEYGEAFLTYLLMPFANVFSLYFASPFVTRAGNRFAINHHKYGDRRFEFESAIGPYYKAFFISLGIFFVGGFLLLLPAIVGLASLMAGSTEGLDPNSTEVKLATIGPIIGLYAAVFFVLLPVMLYYKACVRNITYNNANLDGHITFQSNVNPFRYVWIVFSNTLLAIISLGLMVPWGQVRLARYLASKTLVKSKQGLGGFTSDVTETSGVISSEYVDTEGFDIGFDI